MKVEVKRIFKGTEYTIGKLFIDGNYYCDTLEDVVRTDKKIPGKTAIPAGEYKVKVTWSPRFKRYLPEILNVPGFSGVRIHSGNTASETEGCLLLGLNKEKGKVLNSKNAVEFFIDKTPQEYDLVIG